MLHVTALRRGDQMIRFSSDLHYSRLRCLSLRWRLDAL